MPVQVLVADVFDVTVTVVMHTTLTGVLVIVKLLEAEVTFLFSIKKAGEPEPSSFLEVTLMETPCGGMVDVMVTVSGKSAWGAAGWEEFAGGFSSTVSACSPPPPPPPGGLGVDLLLQLPVTSIEEIAKTNNTDFTIYNSFENETKIR